MQSLAPAWLLLAACGIAHATPTYEGYRTSASVGYESGSVVSVSCMADERCDVAVEWPGGRWTIPHDEMHGLIVVPKGLALVRDEPVIGFVVEVEVGCETYAEILPPYVCMAQLTLEDSRVVDTVVFKRTFEESRDAEPMLRPSAAGGPPLDALGNALVGERMTFSALASHPGDIPRVSVSGCLTVNPLGGPALFADCKSARGSEFEDSIDIGFMGREGPDIPQGGALCIEASGPFYDLKDDSIVTGPSLSKQGVFGAEQWKVIPCNGSPADPDEPMRPMR